VIDFWLWGRTGFDWFRSPPSCVSGISGDPATPPEKALLTADNYSLAA
jgi:hypothetical protein